MRINFYKFPDSVSAEIRYQHGCPSMAGIENCIEAGYLLEYVKLRQARQLWRRYGGDAWYCDVDKNKKVIKRGRIV